MLVLLELIWLKHDFFSQNYPTLLINASRVVDIFNQLPDKIGKKKRAFSLQAVEVRDGAQDAQGGAHAGDIGNDDAATAVFLAQVAAFGILLQVIQQAPKGWRLVIGDIFLAHHEQVHACLADD